MAVLRPGQLVTSTAGRDRNALFLVLRVDEDGFVWVVDGDKRPLEKPKKKNPKHLKAHDYVEKDIAERWSRGEPVKDSEIREVIRAREQDLKEEGEGGRLAHES